MYLGRAGVAHHLHDLEAGRAAHDRIVDQHDALARDQRAIGIVLELDAEVADLVARLDERAPDIVRADDAEFERNARFLRIADRGGRTRIGTGMTRSASTGFSRASSAPIALRTE